MHKDIEYTVRVYIDKGYEGELPIVYKGSKYVINGFKEGVDQFFTIPVKSHSKYPNDDWENDMINGVLDNIESLDWGIVTKFDYGA